MNARKLITLFIVDDNSVFMLALKADIESIFVTMRLKIHLFETGEKCMEHFMHEKPELVILDYHLNSKVSTAANGLEILDLIKKENKECHVIMLTGDDNIDIAAQSFQHGASDYVVKTETQFRKINYSLINLFEIIQTKDYQRKFRQSVIGLGMCVVLIVILAIAIVMYN